MSCDCLKRTSVCAYCDRTICKKCLKCVLLSTEIAKCICDNIYSFDKLSKFLSKTFLTKVYRKYREENFYKNIKTNNFFKNDIELFIEKYYSDDEKFVNICLRVECDLTDSYLKILRDKKQIMKYYSFIWIEETNFILKKLSVNLIKIFEEYYNGEKLEDMLESERSKINSELLNVTNGRLFFDEQWSKVFNKR